MKSLTKAFFVFLIVAATLVSCSDGSMVGSDSTLVIGQIDSSSDGRFIGSTESKTFAYADITATGPNGEELTVNTDVSNFYLEDIYAGDWTFETWVFNANDYLIGTSVDTLTVFQDQVNTIDITTELPSGEGFFSIDLSALRDFAEPQNILWEDSHYVLLTLKSYITGEVTPIWIPLQEGIYGHWEKDNSFWGRLLGLENFVIDGTEYICYSTSYEQATCCERFLGFHTDYVYFLPVMDSGYYDVTAELFNVNPSYSSPEWDTSDAANFICEGRTKIEVLEILPNVESEGEIKWDGSDIYYGDADGDIIEGDYQNNLEVSLTASFAADDANLDSGALSITASALEKFTNNVITDGDVYLYLNGNLYEGDKEDGSFKVSSSKFTQTIELEAVNPGGFFNSKIENEVTVVWKQVNEYGTTRAGSLKVEYDPIFTE